MRRHWRKLLRVGRSLGLGVLATVGVGAIAALTPRQWGTLPQSGNCEYTIYVSAGPMHTNLIVPVQTDAFDWNRSLDLKSIGKNSALTDRYLQFGWGDRRWYVETPNWGQSQLTDVVRVLFFPGNTAALLVQSHRTVPNYPNEEVRCLRLGRTDYLALINFLESSFQRDGQGQIQRLAHSQDNQSTFYAATGTYSILNTCNSWVANGLHQANVNTPLWAGLAPAVMYHLRNGCTCP